MALQQAVDFVEAGKAKYGHIPASRCPCCGKSVTAYGTSGRDKMTRASYYCLLSNGCGMLWSRHYDNDSMAMAKMVEECE